MQLLSGSRTIASGAAARTAARSAPVSAMLLPCETAPTSRAAPTPYRVPLAVVERDEIDRQHGDDVGTTLLRLRPLRLEAGQGIITITSQPHQPLLQRVKRPVDLERRRLHHLDLLHQDELVVLERFAAPPERSDLLLESLRVLRRARRRQPDPVPLEPLLHRSDVRLDPADPGTQVLQLTAPVGGGAAEPRRAPPRPRGCRRPPPTARGAARCAAARRPPPAGRASGTGSPVVR